MIESDIELYSCDVQYIVNNNFLFIFIFISYLASFNSSLLIDITYEVTKSPPINNTKTRYNIRDIYYIYFYKKKFEIFSFREDIKRVSKVRATQCRHRYRCQILRDIAYDVFLLES